MIVDLQHEFSCFFCFVSTSSEVVVISFVVPLRPLVAKQDNCSSVASFLRSAASGGGLARDLDDVTIPDFSDVSRVVLQEAVV